MRPVGIWLGLLLYSLGTPVHGTPPPTSDGGLTLNLYYETLCPDCKVFISQKLCPVWHELGQYFAIQFVPYGNAETRKSGSGGEVEIVCQHGAKECWGNRIQSCALKQLSYNQSVSFICCMEGAPSFDTAPTDCAHQLGIPSGPLLTCANGAEGEELHYLNGVATAALQPPHTWVPWILYDGVYNKEDMERSEEDLVQVLCQHLPHPKPDRCNSVE